jgi:UDP-glucose/galactose:(glucosyl)LPS alpha-1,2-glucosyl/galactosyltransferase
LLQFNYEDSSAIAGYGQKWCFMIDVVYCFNKNYFQHFAASLTSLVLNFKGQPSQLRIHLLSDTTSDLLQAFIEDFQRVFSVDVGLNVITEKQLDVINQIPEPLRNLSHFTVAAYFRLLLPEVMAQQISKVLYLDSDTIILDDISELFSADLQGNALAAVLDPETKVLSKAHKIDFYFNSGVMVLDLALWRREEIARKCLEHLQDPDALIWQADQCAINVILNGRIKEVPSRWNSFTHDPLFKPGAQKDLEPHTAIIHYITKHKPWQAWYSNPRGDFYWQYLNVSLWKPKELTQPATVNENVWMARKLVAEGKSQDAAPIYEKVIRHLLSK